MKKNMGRLFILVLLILVIVFGSYYFYEKYEEESEDVEVTTVVCVGDSLTFRRSYDGFIIYNYPSILSELLGSDYKVSNYGDAGTCVQSHTSAPYVDTRVYKKSVEVEADILVIMLGTNDAFYDRWKDMNTFYENYCFLIDSYLQGENIPEIYLCTVPAVYVADSELVEKEVNQHLEMISSVVCKIAEERNYKVIEIKQLVAEHPEWYELDGVHLNEGGAKGIAMAVAEAIIAKD